MKLQGPTIRAWAVILAFLLAAPTGVFAQDQASGPAFTQEELDQMLAPVALYPDDLLAQIFMASTYPLEVVQADRWVKENENLKGDALAAALEQQNWDPSVKSLVNFPQVLDMMNQQLDWTQRLGDAFLSQQAQVMETVQKLRVKADEAGNLQTTSEQKVIVQKETQTIIIQPANPQVVYVPVYNPTVVYGPWWYPAYPPRYYYPPGYVAGAALFSFGVGVAVGAAWGYAWGGCNWGRHDVDININRNVNINNHIDRSRYSNRVTTGQGGRGEWKHDPNHRKGAPYRNSSTAQKYNRGVSKDAQARESYRGRAETGRQNLAQGSADQYRGRTNTGQQSGQGGRKTDSFQRGGAQQKTPASGTQTRASGSNQRGGVQQKKPTAGTQTGASGSTNRAGASQARTGSSDRTAAQSRTGSQSRTDKSAFSGYDRGAQTKNYSSRGRESMSSSRSSSGRSQSGGTSRGGGGGGSRGGGGRR